MYDETERPWASCQQCIHHSTSCVTSWHRVHSSSPHFGAQSNDRFCTILNFGHFLDWRSMEMVTQTESQGELTSNEEQKTKKITHGRKPRQTRSKKTQKDTKNVVRVFKNMAHARFGVGVQVFKCVSVQVFRFKLFGIDDFAGEWAKKKAKTIWSKTGHLENYHFCTLNKVTVSDGKSEFETSVLNLRFPHQIWQCIEELVVLWFQICGQDVHSQDLNTLPPLGLVDAHLTASTLCSQSFSVIIRKKSFKIDICVLLDLHQKITSSIWPFCSSKLTFLLNWKFWDDLVQSRSNLRDQHLENLESPSHKLTDREDSNSSQESTISTAFDPQHGIRRKIRTSSDLGFESYLLT